MALKPVDNDRVVQMGIANPFNSTGHLNGQAFAFPFVFIGEGCEFSAIRIRVKIFMETIKEEFKKFLGVLLGCCREGLVESARNILSHLLV